LAAPGTREGTIIPLHYRAGKRARHFPFGSSHFSRLVSTIRTAVFDEVAASDLPGLICTFVWADDPRDNAAIDGLVRAELCSA
jgi:hypothetical protein